MADGRTDPFQESGPPNAFYFVEEGEKQEEESEQLRDKSKDQGQKLDEINIATQGEEPKPIFISTGLSEDMKEQVF